MRPPVIATDRLTLRAHGTEDLKDMCAMWAEPQVVRFIGGKVFSREEIWARLLRYAGSCGRSLATASGSSVTGLPAPSWASWCRHSETGLSSASP